MFTFIIIVSVLVQALVALFVLQRNNKNPTNVLFFVLSGFLITWAVINFWITSNPFSSSQLILYRFLMASVVAQNTTFFLFAYAYPNQKISTKGRHIKAYMVLSLAALAATLTPLVFVKVHYGTAGARPVTGPGMLIFGLHAAISIISGLRSIYRRYVKAHGIARQQLQFILFASIILWGIVPITNFVVSLATETLFFARISPIYTFAFSSVIAYTIVTRKLFNIKAAAARSVAYIFTLITLAAIYIVTAFAISSLFLQSHTVDMQTQTTYTVLALILAFSFYPVKKAFDRLTTRLFFQDAYDPQQLFNVLNKVLVAKVDLEELLTETIALINSNLKPESCAVALAGSKTAPRRTRMVGTLDKSFNEHDMAVAHSKHLLVKAYDSVIVTDLIAEENKELGRILDRNNIAVLARLGGNRTGQKELGHIILGPKKNGQPYGSQDIQVIESIANELIIAIQNALHFEEIKNFNVTLQERVHHATSELRRTNDRLKLLDETKDEFITMASHQLRTPLTSVKGYLSMVLEGDVGKLNAQQTQLLGQSFASAQRMVFLISDLLNLSRLNTGKFIIDPSPVDLREVVQAEIDQLAETAKSREVSLTYQNPASFPKLMLDETKIHQVVMNFIDNAIYYTPAGGKIAVSLTETPTAIEYRVQDTGIGVPRSVQHRLFSKFYRADNARRARPDGTGLGLFMAKKVIVAQGGATIFESEEGRGSTFGFRFTKARHLAPDQSSKAHDQA